MSELDGRNIDNTHPAELKRLQQEEIDDKIESLKRKVKFCAVNAIFFAFIGVMVLLNLRIINPYFAIIPGVIALVFGLLFILYRDYILQERLAKIMLDLFYKHYDL